MRHEWMCSRRSIQLLGNHILNCAKCVSAKEREREKRINKVRESVTDWVSVRLRDGGRKIGIETSKRSHNLGKYDIMLLFRTNTCYQIIQTCHNNVARCADKWHMLNCFSVLLIYGEFEMKTRVGRHIEWLKRTWKMRARPREWTRACVCKCLGVCKKVFWRNLCVCFCMFAFECMRECVRVRMRNVYVMCMQTKTSRI